jgi:hypothetical protein
VHSFHSRHHTLIRVRRSVVRVAAAATLVFTCAPAVGVAEESTLPSRTLTLPIELTAAPSLSANVLVSIDEPAVTQDLSLTQITEAPRSSRLGVMVPLYASFAVLQTLDAHSTMRALENGGIESNPLLRDLAGQPAALIAMKAGVTASTIFLVERLRPKHPVGAIVLMAALNSFYATVVVHNYRTVP